MNPLASLVREHRTIIRLSDALEAYAQRLTDGGRDASPDDLGRFAEVFRELVDLMHHEKEEAVLLPFVVEHGFDWDWGTVPEVRREHRQERYLIDVLCQASERAGIWSRDERRLIAATASALADFERQHLAKENTELFPSVLARLSPAAQVELNAKLERFDAQLDQRDRNGRMLPIAKALIARYAPGACAPQATAATIAK
jgi:hemerythrin-like domain-containing protein